MHDKLRKIDSIIAKRIKAARLIAGLSQEEVGRELNISFQQIQKYETGKNSISAAKLWIIALATKHPINYFFNTEDQKEFMDDTNTKTFLSVYKIYNKLKPAQRTAFHNVMRSVVESNQ